MSRQINVYDHKLTQDERDYLEQRGRRHLILQNDRQFADSDAPARAPREPDEDDDEITWEEEVDELNVDELKAELSDRGLSTAGNKPELQKRLKDAGPAED